MKTWNPFKKPSTVPFYWNHNFTYTLCVNLILLGVNSKSVRKKLKPLKSEITKLYIIDGLDWCYVVFMDYNWMQKHRQFFAVYFTENGAQHVLTNPKSLFTSVLKVTVVVNKQTVLA